MNEYQGSWQRRGLIHVPVIPDEPARTLCRVCGVVSPFGLCRACRDSARKREHGSHNGFNQHQRRFELPCESCSLAEKAYQGKRYRRGQLNEVDREWCERNAVKSSWDWYVKQNRKHASVSSNT